MSKHPLNDDGNNRSSIQSQTQICSHHTTLSFTLVHFTCEGTNNNKNGRFNKNTINGNIRTNDTDAAAAAITSEPTIRDSSNKNNNKSIPSTIHDWFQYIESAYGCNHRHDILKGIGHHISQNNDDQNDIQIIAQIPFAPSIPQIQPTPSSLSIWEQTKYNILQYIQHKDQYMNLTSVLLKSYAYYTYYNSYHQYHSSSLSRQPRQQFDIPVDTRPIMILPRTIYNQPYIPNIAKSNATTATPTTSVFSISHQYPIVGLVQLNHPMYSNINEDNLPLEKEVSTTVVAMVGLDIVIFDTHYNPKLYSNLMEYLEVYEEYFTPHEWNDLILWNGANDNNHSNNNNEMNILHEFYIQWSIKEAYTKALGLGMNIDFRSFETEIDLSSTSCFITTVTIENDPKLYQQLQMNHNNTMTSNNAFRCDNQTNHSRLWEWLQQQCSAAKVELSSLSTPTTDHHQQQQQQFFVICTIGTVTQQSSTLHINNNESTNTHNSPHHRPQQERYYFYFYPIFNNDDNISHHHTEMIGCATICYGPIQEIITLPNNQMENTPPLPVPYPNIDVQYMTLQQLIAYHTIPETRVEV